jgi:hypothetical protein
MDIIKNPVVLGVVGGAITYFYMQHKLDEKNKNRIKRGKKPEELNLLIPLAVAFSIWIVAYMYFNSTDNIVDNGAIIVQHNGVDHGVVQQDVFNQVPAQQIQMPMPIKVVPPYRFLDDVQTSGINLDNDEYNGFEVIDHTKLNSLRSDFFDI